MKQDVLSAEERSKRDWPQSGLSKAYDELSGAAVIIDIDEYPDIHAAIYEVMQQMADRDPFGPTCDSSIVPTRHPLVFMEDEGVDWTDSDGHAVHVWRCPVCGRPEER